MEKGEGHPYPALLSGGMSWQHGESKTEKEGKNLEKENVWGLKTAQHILKTQLGCLYHLQSD